MAVNHKGKCIYNPRIVTDGLVLCLDAADPKSYPDSGNVWFDRTNRKDNASAINGAFYQEGSFFLDGVNDYLSLNTSKSLMPNSSLISITSFVKISNILAQSIYTETVDTSNSNRFGLVIDTNNKIRVAGRINDNNAFTLFALSDDSISLNEWTHVGCSCDFTNNIQQLFINGESVSLTNNGIVGTFDGGNSQIRSIGWNAVSNYFGGNIANLHVYNRAISPEEAKQNYNATKSRFGL
jgi:hypothetical protein